MAKPSLHPHLGTSPTIPLLCRFQILFLKHPFFFRLLTYNRFSVTDWFLLVVCSDVLFRHCKKHEQDAQTKAAQATDLIPMQGVTSTTTNQNTQGNGGLYGSTITVACPSQLPTSPAQSSPGSDPGISAPTPMVFPPDPMGVITSAPTPPPSSLAPLHAHILPDQTFDSLEAVFFHGDFETGDILASQDGTSEGSQFDLDWLRLDDRGAPNSAANQIGSGPRLPAQASSNRDPIRDETNGSKDGAISSMFEKHFPHLEQFWVQGAHSKRKIMATMWNNVTVGDGLFNTLKEISTTDSSKTSTNGWTLDSDTKQRVWLAYQTMLGDMDGGTSTAILAPETVEIAYEQYIVHHENVMPLIHLPSFCPQKAPVSLLVAMSTIGLSVMGTRDLNKLVSKMVPDLLRMASDDLDAARDGSVPLLGRLTAMLTAYFVLTLASVTGNTGHMNQTQSLYTRLLTSAELDGLFSAKDYPPTLSELSTIASEEKQWRVWGSIEFIKRLAIHLVQLDCWYSSFLAATPVLRSDSVTIVPPCDDTLFKTRTLDAWSCMRPDFGQMDYPVISASYSNTPLIQTEFSMMPTLLMLLQLRLASASAMLNRIPQAKNDQDAIFPWRLFEEDVRTKSLAMLTVDLARVSEVRDLSFDMNSAISWHAFCISLGANLLLFETAAGRSGPKAASQALKEIFKWASTPSARRSAIHASHIFQLVLHRRVSDPVRLHSIIALFQAALVLGLYILAMPAWGSEDDAFDLYEDVGWVALGPLGLSDLPAELLQPDLISIRAARFISLGGKPSFAHYSITPGYTQARKCWLHFASLMLGLGRWKSRTFSRILHAMCDDLSDVDQAT